jgi:hypothetical protein
METSNQVIDRLEQAQIQPEPRLANVDGTFRQRLAASHSPKQFGFLHRLQINLHAWDRQATVHDPAIFLHSFSHFLELGPRSNGKRANELVPSPRPCALKV